MPTRALNPHLASSDLKSFLERVVHHQHSHTLWLNTLSLLEHIGSRKILLTQSHEGTSEMILLHATEEARHALFFKKAAKSMGKEFCSGYRNTELLKGSSARIYFAKLEACVRRNVRLSSFSEESSGYLAYLYTTTLIELRAMLVYTAYDEVLGESGVSLSLKNLILEEEGHLDEMSKEIQCLDQNYNSRLAELTKREDFLFSRLLRELKAGVK